MAIDYGTDISTDPDLDPAFGSLSGPEVLTQALMRRLSTPQGALPFNPDDGIDLNDWLHRGITHKALYWLKSAIEAECEKDERVYAVAAAVSADSTGEALTIDLAVEPIQGRAFRFTAKLSSFDFTLLNIE